MTEQREHDFPEMLHGLRQLGRYGVVGLINTSIDFALTNTLVILTGASGPAALFVISLFATLMATLNSYRLNKSWTFQLQNETLPKSTLLKYFGVAFLAMMVNTSVFLFVYQFLTDQMQVARLLAINLAKLVGVGTASIVAFLGYRISVFRPAAIEAFRHRFRFDEIASTYSLTTQLTVLVCASALARLLYLLLTTAVYGEAVNYSWVAKDLADGTWADANSGWYNLFCLWQALFYLAGFSPVQCAISASLIPGILLVVPVSWAARRVYGERVAWLAGALTLLHPRLIAYSCNGAPDCFSLLMLSTGVALLAVAGCSAMSNKGLVGAGLCFGAYFSVDNEGIVCFLIILLGCSLLARRARRRLFETFSPLALAPLRSCACALLGFCIAVGAYAASSEVMIGNAGLFKRLSVFEKKYSEQLDPVSSAREVYGIEGSATMGHWEESTLTEKLWTWLTRFPANLLYTLRIAPGVFLTPFWFFALMLPLFARSRDGTLLPEWPWLALLFFPFLVYPLIFIEARFLFPSILAIHFFGAAGLVALAQFLGTRSYLFYFYPGIIGATLAACMAITAWRGHQIEQGYDYQRVLASWIQGHVPHGETLVGDGYGFVATTGFLAQYPTINRLIHYDPAKVVEFVKEKNAKWLILYEPFAIKVNPELLSSFSTGMPGMQLEFQVVDHMGRRVQVYEIKDFSQTH